MRTVPSNQLQRQLINSHNENLSPGTGTTHTALGNILEVYDRDKLALITPDRTLLREIEANPGLLFAKVRLLDGMTHILPFKEPEDQIYLTYGNGVHLEGRRIKIEWTGMNITNGYIIMTRTHLQEPISITQAGLIFDIGGII